MIIYYNNKPCLVLSTYKLNRLKLTLEEQHIFVDYVYVILYENKKMAYWIWKDGSTRFVPFVDINFKIYEKQS